MFSDNRISSDDNDIINIDTNIVSPYIFNEEFRTTVATFSSVDTIENFVYYCPNNLVFYKIRANEIHDIDIFISDRNHNQLNLLAGIPTIVKLILKSDSVMDFTSNFSVSNRALSVSNFCNRNSFFRVNMPSNDIFQSETPEISVCSIVYPNNFKVLPSYLKSSTIKRFYMYSNEMFSVRSMQLNQVPKDSHSIKI